MVALAALCQLLPLGLAQTEAPEARQPLAQQTRSLSEQEHDPPWYEVSAPGVRVLYQDPAITDHARQVAGRAHFALDRLAELFRTEPPPVTIELDGRTDLFGAVAPPLPRPLVSLPALFPAEPQVDLATRDPLLELLLHELTHSVQLSYLERPDGVSPLPRLGLLGEAVAPAPPGWLLEGLAVWVAESLSAPLPSVAPEVPERALFEHRNEPLDARTTGVLYSLALDGQWPTLQDVSLLSHREWPGGEARYLLGGAFVGELIEEYGWETLLLALRHANAGWYPLPFSEAWRRASGGELDEAWQRWQREVSARALTRANSLAADGAVELTASGEASTVLALSPSGERLAWRPASGGLLVSRVTPTALAGTAPVLPADVYPRDLTWSDEGTLVFTRLMAGPDELLADLFALDLASGRITRLTHGERVRFPRGGPEGCIWYVRDVVSEGSELRKLCGAAQPERVFTAPEGMHLVGLAISSGEGTDSGERVAHRERVALSVWRNGFVDLALLEEGRLRWLTQDPAQDLDPTWWGEELVFRSDRGAVFELYSLRPGDGSLGQLSDSLGGAFGPSGQDDELVFARLGGRGYGLATLTADRTVARVPLNAKPVPPAPPYFTDFPVRPYRAGSSLLPYGWFPSLTVTSVSPLALSTAVTILGQDASGDHSYAVRFGYDPRIAAPHSASASSAVTAGIWANMSYDYRSTDLLDLFQRPPPLSFGVSVGAFPWHDRSGKGERALAALAELRLRGHLSGWPASARFRGGVVYLPSYGAAQPDARVDIAISRRTNDLWGYGVRGSRFSVHSSWSADASGGSSAAWLAASTVLPPGGDVGFSTELSLRAGLRPSPPIPLQLTGIAAIGSAALRDSIELGWRAADGLFAVERLSLQARVHLFYDEAIGTAFDGSLWADTMVRYGAPVSLGFSGGYVRGWWYRVGARLPL